MTWVWEDKTDSIGLRLVLWLGDRYMGTLYWDGMGVLNGALGGSRMGHGDEWVIRNGTPIEEAKRQLIAAAIEQELATVDG